MLMIFVFWVGQTRAPENGWLHAERLKVPNDVGQFVPSVWPIPIMMGYYHYQLKTDVPSGYST